MRQRGRKAVTAVPNVIQGAFQRRPEPPEDLNERQSEIWRLVVASEDPLFFDTGALRGLLADYCRRREAAEKVSEVINMFKAEWLKSEDGAHRYKILLQMRDIEVRGATSLATKLRLTNQSRYTTQSAATAARNAQARVAKPWEL
jgi:hypothetical protein